MDNVFTPAVGVYWGAFDPPTPAHFAIMESSLQNLKLKKLIVVINNHSYKKYAYPLSERRRVIEFKLQESGLKGIEILDQDDSKQINYRYLRQRINDPLYRNNLKNRDFGKESPQNFLSGVSDHCRRQDASEDKNSEVKPTQPKTDSSSCFGIYAIAGYDAYIRWQKFSSERERNEYDAIIVVPRGDQEPILYDQHAVLMRIDSRYKYVSSSEIKS